MIRPITILILVCLHGTILGQGTFQKALRRLSDIGYHLTISKNCKTQTIEDGFGCKITPSDNWYNQRLKTLRMALTDTVNCATIRVIESFSVTGSKELQPKVYGRAEVMKWTFFTVSDAENADILFSKIDPTIKEDLYKAPWTWWRDNESVYFILTAGTYASTDLNKIESKLRRALRQN